MVKGQKKRPAAIADGPRLRRLNRRQKKQKAKKEARTRPPLPGSFRLSWRALLTIRLFWRPLAGITVVYLILNIFFASGISNLSSVVSDIKFDIDSASEENLSPFSSALSGFGNLVASAGTGSSGTGSILQSVLIVIESLVIIWALRHLMAGQKIRVKAAYYNSMYPLIPFLLVIAVILIQFLPVLIGLPIVQALLSAVFVSGGTGAVILFVFLAALLLGWSLYMVSSSIFALYIVTLPDMHPRRALRSAKNLVRFRRWTIMRKLLYLPVFILAVMLVLVLPLILFATFLVTPVFFALSLLSLLFSHVYLYSLYRELIK